MSNKAKKICKSPRDKNTGKVSSKGKSNCRTHAPVENTIILSKTKIDAMLVQEEEIDAFLHLIDTDCVIQQFLKSDTCVQLADRYLIAMVFTYFKRARYTIKEFTRYNFFVALYLAHDIEEDDEDIKYELYIWALGNQWQQHYKEMLDSRNVLWKSMDHRAIVSRACCEMVIAFRPDHPVWLRIRPMAHAGANRPYAVPEPNDCYKCNRVNCFAGNDSGIFGSGDETESCNSDASRVAGSSSSSSSVDVCELLLSDSIVSKKRICKKKQSMEQM